MTAAATKRQRWAWYMYDFGNSAYASVVLMAVFSTYFKEQVVGGAAGSRMWGISIGIAMLVVAVTSPILGAVADYSGAKKRFLLLFTIMSCVCTALLFTVGKGNIVRGVVFFVLAEIGYRSAQVFYNGLLPEIAEPHEIAAVSGRGWAIGSAGGVVCLLIILPLIAFIGGATIVRLSLVITAVFFALSTIPLFLWLPEKAPRRPLPEGETFLTLAFKRLSHTIRAAGRFREFVKFIAAFLVYNDGVIMALDFAAIMGAVLFGLDQQLLIVFVIMVNVTNVIGAYVLGIAAEKVGHKRALVWSIILMIACVIWMFFGSTPTEFFVIGAFAGFAMAGIQALSRSLVGLISPEGQSAEFYGFFAVAGRSASFIGPTVYGVLAAAATGWYQAQGQSAVLAEMSGQRVAVLSIGAFLLVGLVMLLLFDESRASAAARMPSPAPAAE